MKKKLVCLLTAAAMSISLLAGCGSTAATTASSAAPAASSAAVESTAAGSSAAATAASTAAATDGDLADKKVGVCIYQFSDNFMTLFRNELESYLESKGFKKGEY
jgi:methyl-galactoside transport system substrate-binding protein